MKTLIAVLTALLISGCASTSVSEFKSPDGVVVKKVKCTSDPTKCFALASESCPKPGTYQVVSSQSNSGGLVADLIPGPITWYAMTFACGASDGKMPDFQFVGQRYTAPPPSAQPLVIKNQPINTSCTKYGNTVNCTSN